MSNAIVFYDILSTIPGAAWSFNTWKTRYTLNFKGIAYKTVWVEPPDIEAKCKKIGALPTGKKPDGSPHYTLPAIYDPSTGAAVSESTNIAIYLDTAYPDTPKLFPPGSHELQSDILDFHFQSGSMMLRQFTMPAAYRVVGSRVQVFFRSIGVTEDLEPTGKRREEEWAKVKEAFSVIASQLPHKKGPYIMGSEISFLDFMVAGHLISMKKLFGEDSTEWNDMKTWNSGRWAMVLKSVEKYEMII